MEIEKTKLDEYNSELANAMNQLKRNLSECQVMIGIMESFIYLTRKEMGKETISKNGQGE